MKHDVCVVGAGIAGSSLAYELVSDFDVCVIEQRDLDEVGRKPCPGAVESSWFQGFSPSDFGAVSLRIRNMRLSIGERSLRVRFHGYVINRHRFCKGLLEAAISEGCEWVKGRAEPSFENGINHIRVGKRRIGAEVYVDASGSSAVLRRYYVPNKREMFALGCMETVSERERGDELEIYLINHRETGWVFPAEHSTNVGYVLSGTGVRGLEVRLESFKRWIGLGEARTLERGYGLIPNYKPIGLVHDNLVAIGDSGFTINPVTCGGIGPSVLAANLLAESFKKGEGLEVFEARYWGLLGKKFDKFYRINSVLRKGWLPLWLAVRAYYGDNSLGKLIKRLLRL